MTLIINADDFGFSHHVNLAIDYCFKRNLIHRTSLMVNMEACEHAVAMAKCGGYSDKVGLHLNLIEGLPLTDPVKETCFCTNGFFNGKALKTTINRFHLDKKTKSALKCEIRAQIETYLSYNFPLKHLDSHEHAHTNPSVFSVLYPLLKEYNFASIRPSRNIPPSEIKGLKKIYKNRFNKKVFSFFSQADTQWKIEYFGSLNDVEKIRLDHRYDNAKIEVESHPILDQNGLLCDALHPISIEKWLAL